MYFSTNGIRSITENIVTSPIQTFESGVPMKPEILSEAVDSRPLYTETMSVESWIHEKQILKTMQRAQTFPRTQENSVQDKYENEFVAPRSNSVGGNETVYLSPGKKMNVETTAHNEARIVENQAGTFHGVSENVLSMSSDTTTVEATAKTVPSETMKTDFLSALPNDSINTMTSTISELNISPLPSIGFESNFTIISSNEKNIKTLPPKLPSRDDDVSPLENPKTIGLSDPSSHLREVFTNFNKEGHIPRSNIGRPPNVNVGRPPSAAPLEPNLGRNSVLVPPSPTPPPTTYDLPPAYPNTFNPDPISKRPKDSFKPVFPSTFSPKQTLKKSALDLRFITRNCRFRRPFFGSPRPEDIFYKPSTETPLGRLIEGLDGTWQIDICHDCYEGWKRDQPYGSALPGHWVKRNRNGKCKIYFSSLRNLLTI